eukprot:1143307-Pelagomonas_calceolata.AAC.5
MMPTTPFGIKGYLGRHANGNDATSGDGRVTILQQSCGCAKSFVRPSCLQTLNGVSLFSSFPNGWLACLWLAIAVLPLYSLPGLRRACRRNNAAEERKLGACIACKVAGLSRFA